MRPWSPTGDSATAMGVAIKIIRRQSGAVMDCLPPAIIPAAVPTANVLAEDGAVDIAAPESGTAVQKEGLSID